MKPSLLILMTALGTSALPGAVITSPSGHGEGAHGETIAKSADNSYYSKWYSKFSRGLSWQLELPGPRFLQSYSFVYANDEPSRDPKSWIVEASEDGKKFVKVSEVVNYPSQLRYATRFFPINDPGNSRFYRIRFLENHGSSGFQIAEIAFSDDEVRERQGKATVPTVSSPSGHMGKKNENITKTLDRNKRTKWFTPYSKGLSWQLELPESRICTLYRLTSANDYPGRDPESWIVEGSRNGKDFVKIAEESNAKFETRLLEKEFRIAAPGSYRFYRLTFRKAVNGKDGFQIAEIEFK